MFLPQAPTTSPRVSYPYLSYTNYAECLFHLQLPRHLRSRKTSVNHEENNNDDDDDNDDHYDKIDEIGCRSR